jgi:hypothetical protein
VKTGPVSVDVVVRCLRRPVHSGQKGGPVPDAAQILCRLIADAGADRRWRGILAVVALESHPFHGCSNRITDAARARLSLHAGPDLPARVAGERLLRALLRHPPYGAQVRARIASGR